MSNKITPEQFYNDFAANYDNVLRSPKYNVQHLHEAKKIFEKHEIKEGSILDVGCGTGFLKDLLQGDFSYTGIDVSSNMLEYAKKRGYITIHQPIETALKDINTKSYDFVVSLSSLLMVEDLNTALDHMYRIARKAILLSLDDTTEDYRKNFIVPTYNHSKIDFPNAKEDYFILGWKSPTVDIPIYTRMIYIDKLS